MNAALRRAAFGVRPACPAPYNYAHRASLSTLRRPLNPKGIPQQSPGLRGTSYPGKTHAPSEPTLKGLWPTTTEIKPCRNPVGVVKHPPPLPRVARSSQPRAELHNPVGIEYAR